MQMSFLPSRAWIRRCKNTPFRYSKLRRSPLTLVHHDVEHVQHSLTRAIKLVQRGHRIYTGPQKRDSSRASLQAFRSTGSRRVLSCDRVIVKVLFSSLSHVFFLGSLFFGFQGISVATIPCFWFSLGYISDPARGKRHASFPHRCAQMFFLQFNLALTPKGRSGLPRSSACLCAYVRICYVACLGEPGRTILRGARFLTE